MEEPLVLPVFEMPDAVDIPTPVLEMPKPELPEIEPIFLPQKVEPGSVDQLAESEEEESQKESKKDQPAQAKPPEPPAPSISGIDIDKILQQAQPFLEQIQERDIPFGEPSVQPEEPVSLPEEKMEGVTSVQVLGLAIPMPEPEILVAAGATATVSVGATLASTAVYKRAVTAFKPIIKKLITAYQKSRGQETTSWGRERLAQRLHKLPNTDYRGET